MSDITSPDLTSFIAALQNAQIRTAIIVWQDEHALTHADTPDSDGRWPAAFAPTQRAEVIAYARGTIYRVACGTQPLSDVRAELERAGLLVEQRSRNIGS